MNKSRIILIAAISITVLGIGGFIWYFYENTETYEEDIYVGYRGMARRNPFLAAEFMLKELN